MLIIKSSLWEKILQIKFNGGGMVVNIIVSNSYSANNSFNCFTLLLQHKTISVFFIWRLCLVVGHFLVSCTRRTRRKWRKQIYYFIFNLWEKPAREFDSFVVVETSLDSIYTSDIHCHTPHEGFSTYLSHFKQKTFGVLLPENTHLQSSCHKQDIWKLCRTTWQQCLVTKDYFWVFLCSEQWRI